MTWFGRILGIMGCRTIQKNGSHVVVKPPRIPVLLHLGRYSTPALVPERKRPFHPKGNNKIQFGYDRSFWTWRGGDDKKWKFKDGTEEDGTNMLQEDGAVTIPQMERSVSLTYKQAFLSNPSSYPISVCTAQGFRSYMEDEFFFSQDGEFAAVFDGHGGQAVSRYLRKNLYANVQAFLPAATPSGTLESKASGGDQDQPMKRASATVEDYENAIVSALDKVDREVQRISHWSYQGSTAVAIWLHEEKNTENETPQRTVIAANVGDSRAVLCRNDTAYDLTRDHKPDDPLEQSRIEALGGQVVWCGDRDKFGEPIMEQGIYRVNGNLALSRAIGDRSERPHVTAEPEVVTAPMVDGDDFIIIATDGLWDVFDSDEAVDFILSLRTDGHQLERISTLVVEEGLRRGTYDNITVVIIWLDRNSATKSD